MYKQPEWLQKLVRLPDVDANIKSFGGHKQQVPSGWTAEKESHFAFEIMMIISGSQETKFQSMTRTFVAGDIILIPPGIEHENTCVSQAGLEYFCIHFDIDDPFVQQQLLMYCPLKLRKDVPAYNKINKLLNNYVELLNTTAINFRQKLHVEKLLISLLDYADAERHELEISDNTSLLLAISIAETIQNNFRKFVKSPKEEKMFLLSLEETAKCLSISESNMLKTFKKVYGISPKGYLNQLKYNEAKYLLHQPNITITEIAEMIGYQNASHFSRQFKKWSGYSPSQFRKIDVINE